MKAYIIHENDEWTSPLKENLQKLSVPFEDWHMAKVILNTASNPPEGVFYNRMSASSHSRGHRFAPEYTAVILNWLSSHKRRIINNGQKYYILCYTLRSISITIRKKLE